MPATDRALPRQRRVRKAGDVDQPRLLSIIGAFLGWGGIEKLNFRSVCNVEDSSTILRHCHANKLIRVKRCRHTAFHLSTVFICL
ncbi:hypothetical protein NGR_b18480 (plasmid) [Sinorhizobium fredii NGR234]|uniref:Uncharacterized protein n=1 Tax=Sinorhizobium fredii (strain NBRC 101917 / NGR234) TaxID=394 RepID=C3KLL0_SINFN|nr:hypothetical protein NGR_b18480 [Sinorhizobium fredii NGR234]